MFLGFGPGTAALPSWEKKKDQRGSTAIQRTSRYYILYNGSSGVGCVNIDLDPQ